MLAENLHGVKGIGSALAHHIAIAHGKARLVGHGQFSHVQARARIGTARARFFMVRVAGGQKNHALQPDFIGKRTRNVQMAVVDGVESAAEKSDIFHHFLIQAI